MEPVEDDGITRDLAASSLLVAFRSLSRKNQTSFLEKLVVDLEEGDRVKLQNALSPLINNGIIVDDLRVHYIMVNTGQLNPRFGTPAFLRCYDRFAHHFGGSYCANLVFAGQVTKDTEAVLGHNEVCLNYIENEHGDFHNLWTRSADLVPILTGLRQRNPMPPSTTAICFKVDPFGVWENRDVAPPWVFKKVQTAAPITWIINCIDICFEIGVVDVNRKTLHAMSRGHMKYHLFNLEVDGQTRRVCYVEHDRSV